MSDHNVKNGLVNIEIDYCLLCGYPLRIFEPFTIPGVLCLNLVEPTEDTDIV